MTAVHTSTWSLNTLYTGKSRGGTEGNTAGGGEMLQPLIFFLNEQLQVDGRPL